MKNDLELVGILPTPYVAQLVSEQSPGNDSVIQKKLEDERDSIQGAVINLMQIFIVIVTEGEFITGEMKKVQNELFDLLGKLFVIEDELNKYSSLH